jgi:hypothetical protein
MPGIDQRTQLQNAYPVAQCRQNSGMNMHHGRTFTTNREEPVLAHSGRLQLARCVVVDGWGLRRAAGRFNVSAQTVTRLVPAVSGFRGDGSGRPQMPARVVPPPDRAAF